MRAPLNDEVGENNESEQESLSSTSLATLSNEGLTRIRSIRTFASLDKRRDGMTRMERRAA